MPDTQDSIHIEKDTTRRNMWHVWQDGTLVCTCTDEKGARRIWNTLRENKALLRLMVQNQRTIEDLENQLLERGETDG